MMDNWEYIESYFSNEPDAERAREIEEKIVSDPVFAEDVAFYLSVLKVSRENSQSEKKLHFKEIYQKNELSGPDPVKTYTASTPVKNISSPRPVRKLVYYIAAAAAVAGIIFATFSIINPVSPQQLADRYIKEHLQTLGVTMSSRSDSLQTGLRLYNDGRFDEALLQFEKIIQSDTSNFTAKEYAGISALRLKEYDKALSWFEALETYNGHYSNPASFYQALTLMERNQPGDVAKAKNLMKRIVDEDMEGKQAVQDWPKKLK
jgi:tetratricopeptide (TPR) repeat protein